MEDDGYRFRGPPHRSNNNYNYNNNNYNNSSSSSSPPLLYHSNGGLSKKNRNSSTSTSTGTPPPLYDRRSPPTVTSSQPKKYSSQQKKHPTRPPYPLYRNISPSSSSSSSVAADGNANSNSDGNMVDVTTNTTTSSIIDFEEQIKADDYLFEQQLEDHMSSLQLQHPLDHLSMSLAHQHQHQKHHHQLQHHQSSHQQHQQSYDFLYGVQSTDIGQRVNLRTEDGNGRPSIGLQLEVPDPSIVLSSFSVAADDNNDMEMMMDPQVAALLGYPLSAVDSTTSSMMTAVNNPVMLSNGTNIIYHKNSHYGNNGRLNNSSSPTGIIMRGNNGMISSPSRLVDSSYSKSPSPSSNSQHHQHHLASSVGVDDPLDSLLFDDDPSLNSADYVRTHTAVLALELSTDCNSSILHCCIIIAIAIIINIIVIFIGCSGSISSMIT